MKNNRVMAAQLLLQSLQTDQHAALVFAKRMAEDQIAKRLMYDVTKRGAFPLRSRLKLAINSGMDAQFFDKGRPTRQRHVTRVTTQGGYLDNVFFTWTTLAGMVEQLALKFYHAGEEVAI